MILSVSRRTDIPNYYSSWFYKRVEEGFLYVKNPMNARQISKIDISPEMVDCIVFWTKNPQNMISKLHLLKDYKYYFQFSITCYGKDIEPNIPNKIDTVVPIFQKLSDLIGSNKVVWRYDPIFISEQYTVAYHLEVFHRLSQMLKGYTNRVIISFIDYYPKIKKNIELHSMNLPTREELIQLSEGLAQIAKSNNMKLETCAAEKLEVQSLGVASVGCIDKSLVEEIIGCEVSGKRDKNQRNDCICLESIDIGTYDTCKNGCKYCYANLSDKKILKTTSLYNTKSPILCGSIQEEDKITIRKVGSLKTNQITMF